MTGNSYFPGLAPQLTAKLDDFLASLRTDLEQQPGLSCCVIALVLAGGYGRGEGGIFQCSADAPLQLYNDLEFYLIVRPGASLAPLTDWCARHSHRGETLIGIEVEFKILHSPQLSSGQPSMFYYDLLSSNHVVFGPEEFLATLPDTLRNAALIPAEEATRLLFNRGSGLLFSKVALQESSPRVVNGFVERNHAKVRLALADAVLALNGRYHFSCLERQQRLDAGLDRLPPDWPMLREWHKQGVEFKLHPRHQNPEPAELQKIQNDICKVWMRTFLWLESNRLKTRFHTPEDYAGYSGRLYPQTSPWRNLSLAVRDRLQRDGMLTGIFDYPRAALQRALVLLLQPEPGLPKAGHLVGVRKNPTLNRICSAYNRWWNHYN